MNRATRRSASRVILLLTAMATVSCAINPITGRRELALISEAQEIEMGRQGSAQVISSVGLVPDPALQSYVDRIGQAMAASSERPELAWEFHVLDDASVNAFAMPGGYIFVTRGILTHMTNEAQLASVLGHEIAHVTARHSVQQMSRQQLGVLGLGLGSVLSPTVAEYGQLGSAGLGLLFLKHGRDHERQSDQLGFGYALASGYDTRQMITVFEMLRRDAELAGLGRLPEWQSSHPDPGNRIRDVERMVAASNEDFGSKRVAGNDFLERLDGMVYGEDPRLGYFQGPAFIHPGLRFVLAFPDGWATQNAADAVIGVSPARDAVIQLRAAAGSAPEAARRFLAQEGLRSGASTTASIHGNPAVTTDFSAPSDQGGSVAGVVTFIEYDGATWGILAYAAADRFPGYRPALVRSLNSFQRLTDPAALAVQPMRIGIERTTGAMSLGQFNTARASSIPLAELAMINGLDETSQLLSGQSMKRVTGTPRVTSGAGGSDF